MQDSYMRILADKGGIKLDPRTKIFILIIINISAFTVNAWYVMAMVAIIPLSLFTLRKRYKIAVIFTSIYTASLFIYALFIDSPSGVISIIAGMLTGVVCRMGPGLLLGYYLITTTTVSEFIAAMERIHLPKQIVIPLSVMFRFFPTVKEESSSINDAMRMRGISLGKSKGGLISMMEYRLVPLFISCVKIGEELSCSALTRGLGSPVKRTNICKIGFGAIDFAYIFLTVVILICFIVVKSG